MTVGVYTKAVSIASLEILCVVYILKPTTNVRNDVELR